MTSGAPSAFQTLLWLASTDASGRVRRGPFYCIAALCFILTAMSVFLGNLDLRERRQEVQRLIAGRQEGPGGSSGRQMQPAFREVREPEPLSILVRGLEPSVPLAWDFSPSGAYPTGFISQPASRTWTMSLDLEFISRILLSLLAVLTATGGLRAQRGVDALRDLRSLPILPPIVVGSQIVGGLLAMAIANGAVIAGALSIVPVRPEIRSPDFLVVLGELFFVSWAYTIVFYMIGLGISLSSRNLHSALATSVIVWAVIALTAPPLTDLLIHGRRGAVTMSADASQQQRFDESVRATEQELGAAVAALTLPGQSRDLALLQPNTKARLEEIWARSVADRRADLARTSLSQMAPSASKRFWLSLISPATSLSAAMTRLVGTGEPLATRWNSAILNRETELNRAFFDDPARLSIRIPASRGGEFLSYTRHASVQPSSIPRRPIPQETSAERLRSALVPLFQLWILALVLAGFLLRRFS